MCCHECFDVHCPHCWHHHSPSHPACLPACPPPPVPPLGRYGAEQGRGEVREALCRRLYERVGRKPAEIFVSDGSKCDIGRLQLMFGVDVSVALQVKSRGGSGWVTR